jgi:hypothetical protein
VSGLQPLIQHVVSECKAGSHGIVSGRLGVQHQAALQLTGYRPLKVAPNGPQDTQSKPGRCALPSA